MRVIVKFTDDTIVPFVIDALPQLDPPFDTIWAQVVASFGFVTLSPLVTDVDAADLQAMVTEAEQANPGEIVPNPALCFGIDVPSNAFPDEAIAAQTLVDALNPLPFVEYAELAGELAEAVNPSQNPAAVFQRYLNDAPVGVGSGAAWAQPGGDGFGVSVAVLEMEDYDRGHPDRPILSIELAVPMPQVGDHATSVVGIIAAADNTTDCVGLVPVAQVVFASSKDNATMGSCEMFNHLMMLGVQLVRGDVLNISMGLAAPANGPNATLPVEANRVTVSALRLLTLRGITCVVAAGNGPADLDNPSVQLFASGAIVVGAIQPSNPPATTFARHLISNFGSRVDCCSWGSEFQALVVRPGGANPTSKFHTGIEGGTSFATAIISGVVAAVQGRARASTGTPLTPLEIATLLRDPTMGHDVVPGGGVGLQPDLAAIIPTL